MVTEEKDVSYSQEIIDDVLAYIDEGHTIREAEQRFGIGRSSASRWKRMRDGVTAKSATHPVKYPMDVVRRALGLAYGGYGLRLAEVAAMLGVSAPTISNWKRKYVDGGAMDIPELDPDEVERISDSRIDEMADEELKEYIHKLELKAAVLESTVKVLKAEGVEDLTNDELAAVVDALPGKFGVTEALAAVGLSSSSYYYCKSKARRADRYVRARAAIREEFALVGGRRGYRYIRQRLRERKDPIVLSGKTVRRLMAEEGCRVSYHRKRRAYSSYAGEIGAAPANLVARDFHADAPNRLWLTDITQFSIPAGKVYLSPVIDCFDGMPVSWRIGTSPDAELANSMLEGACAQLADGEHPVCHSDRGCHYRWPGWIRMCEEHGIVRSMSKKGCSPDNSACEGFFGRLKNEFFYDRDWDGETIEGFTEKLDAYMRYYRDERIKESLGWLSPMQYRKSLGLVA